MDVFATLIFLITCFDPGRCDNITSAIVRKMRRMIVIKELRGLTSVAILGKMGVSSTVDVTLDR